MPRFDIDLPMYLALSAPDPTFDPDGTHMSIDGTITERWARIDSKEDA